MKAVIPAAGLGTRFLPITKSSPKEMLPIIDRPAIQYVVEEAINSGIEDIVIVTGRGKEAIERYFDMAYELERVLEERGEMEKLQEVRRISEMASIFFVRQKMPLGLGHAIYVAKNHMGEESFAVLLGDDIIVADKPCIKQLREIHKKYGCSVVAVQEVEKEDVRKYGIVEGEEVEKGVYRIERMIEKPSPEETASRNAIMGRYILTPAIFKCIERTEPGKKGEIQLTDALNLLLEKEDIYAYEFRGRRYDLGNKFDWLRINVEMAMQHDDFREKMRKFLQKILQD